MVLDYLLIVSAPGLFYVALTLCSIPAGTSIHAAVGLSQYLLLLQASGRVSHGRLPYQGSSCCHHTALHHWSCGRQPPARLCGQHCWFHRGCLSHCYRYSSRIQNFRTLRIPNSREASKQHDICCTFRVGAQVSSLTSSVSGS